MKDILKGAVLVGLFLVPFLTLYVANDYFFPFITGKNFAFRIIVEVVLSLWVVLAFYDAQYRPRFSWILASFGALIAVMFVANLNAVHQSTAFWSNFERMDGYVTLIHVFLYFVVLGSMLRTPLMWSYFLHTSVVVAGFVALKGLSQLTGEAVRVDSTLGNAAYMAVYMLFHVFILAYLFAQTKVTPYRIIYALLIVLFVYVLILTGTRGTSIGLVVGALVSVGYIALFATRAKQVRKYALGALAAVVLLVGAFIAARDTAFIQNTPALVRIASIDLGSDLSIRSIIWGMAVEGVKEKPLFGWGQGNFNYAFNEQYDPRLYAQEQWFDRTHNIVLDWLIAGGIVGFLAYVSIFAAILYYLFILPIRNNDERFSVIERGILLGLIAGYVTHNLVVFDNIVSYMFFAVILGLIHSRVGTDMPKLMKMRIPEAITTQVVLPVALIVMVAVVYVVNVPNIQAAKDIIVAFQSRDIKDRLANFETALSRGSFSRQEIVEQFAQQAMGLASSNDTTIPAEIKDTFKARAEEELLALAESKPGDARLHVFLASYYRATSDIEKAKEQIALARKFSPRKQAIILQQGAIELSLGNNEGARDFFKEAYELDTRNEEAKEYYIASLFYTRDVVGAKAMIAESSDEFKKRLALSDFVVSAVNTAGEMDYMAELYEVRVVNDTSNAQNWASLAFLYYQIKEQNKAIDTLTRASAAVPSFAPTAQCLIGNLQAGREPQIGCQ